jgi:hypothetical protein
VFLVESRHTTLHNHTLRVNINIQSKKKRNFQKNYQTRRHFTFNIIKVCYLVYLQEYAMYVRLNFAIFNLTSISMYNTPCVDINTSYVEIQTLCADIKTLYVDINTLYVDMHNLYVDISTLKFDIKTSFVDMKTLYIDVSTLYVDTTHYS